MSRFIGTLSGGWPRVQQSIKLINDVDKNRFARPMRQHTPDSDGCVTV